MSVRLSVLIKRRGRISGRQEVSGLIARPVYQYLEQFRSAVLVPYSAAFNHGVSLDL